VLDLGCEGVPDCDFKLKINFKVGKNSTLFDSIFATEIQSIKHTIFLNLISCFMKWLNDDTKKSIVEKMLNGTLIFKYNYFREMKEMRVY
jgi:hypothetical protein